MRRERIGVFLLRAMGRKTKKSERRAASERRKAAASPPLDQGPEEEAVPAAEPEPAPETTVAVAEPAPAQTVEQACDEDDDWTGSRWPRINKGRLTEQEARERAFVDAASLDDWPKVVQMIDEVGVDIDLLADTGTVDPDTGLRYRKTALAAATAHNKLNMARLLLEKGANPNLVSTTGVTPLMEASAQGYLSLVRLLVEHNADVHVVDPVNGTVAFHWACANGHAECVECLVRAGCDKSVRARNGKSGLQVATDCGHTAVVDRLKALVKEQLAAATTSPFQLAVADGNLDCVEALARAGVTTGGNTDMSAAVKQRVAAAKKNTANRKKKQREKRKKRNKATASPEPDADPELDCTSPTPEIDEGGQAPPKSPSDDLELDLEPVYPYGPGRDRPDPVAAEGQGASSSEASSYPAVADAPTQSQEDSDDPFDDLDELVVDEDEELAPAAPQDGEFPRGSAPAHAQPAAVAAAAPADPGIAELESAANRQLPPQAPPPAPAYTADGENIAVGAEFGTLQVCSPNDLRHIYPSL